MEHINKEVERGISNVICMIYEDLLRPSFKELGKLFYFILRSFKIVVLLITFLIIFSIILIISSIGN